MSIRMPLHHPFRRAIEYSLFRPEIENVKRKSSKSCKSCLKYSTGSTRLAGCEPPREAIVYFEVLPEEIQNNNKKIS